MRFTVEALAAPRASRDDHIWVTMERHMKCATGFCGRCQYGPWFVCKDGPVFRYDTISHALRAARATDDRDAPPAPRGLQARVVRRLPAAGARPRGRAAGAHRARWRSRTSRRRRSRPDDGRRFDVALVEGSVSAPVQLEHVREIRARSDVLITIGACATAGGIQALRNWRDVDEVIRVVYARPDYIDTLATSTPVSDHVKVDFELRGCPIDKRQLLELITAYLVGRQPAIRDESVCMRVQARAATSASWSRAGSRASGRSPTPAAARSARATTAAATAASARRRTPEHALARELARGARSARAEGGARPPLPRLHRVEVALPGGERAP